MQKQLIEQLLQFNEITKQKAKKYTKKRYIFNKLINEKNSKQIIGISGLRGIGKTTLLSQLLNKLPNSFYISCDTLENISIYDLVVYFHKTYKVKYFFLDEIHYHSSWEKELKLIYDFSGVKIFFSSSVSLNILQSKHDLARRVKIINIPIFSLAEYLDFKHNIKLKTLGFQEIIKSHQQIFPQYFHTEAYFQEYLRHPLPFMLEDPQLDTVERISKKIIEKDIFYCGGFTSQDIDNLKKVLRFIASTPLAEANYSILSTNIGITKYKAKQYVEFLEKGYLLKSILPYSSNVNREPKILLNLPFRFAYNQYAAPDRMLGALREEFFVHNIAHHVDNIYYLKSKVGTKTPDYLINYQDAKYIFEIGGRGKGYSQFKGLNQYDQKYVLNFPSKAGPNKIPLVLFGLLTS